MPNSGEKYNFQTERESEEEVEYEEVEAEEEIDEEGEEEVEYEEVEVEEEMEEDQEEIEEEEEAMVEEDEDAEDEERTNGTTSESFESDEYAKDLDLIKSALEESESTFAYTSMEVTDSVNDKEAPYSSVTNVLDKHTLKESGCSETFNHEKEIVENQTFVENVQVKKNSPHEGNVLDKHTSSNESGCSETSNHEKEITQNQTSDVNVQAEKDLSPQEINVLDKHISLIESGCSETSNHEKEIAENQSPDGNVKQVKTTLSPQEVNIKGSTKKSIMEIDSNVGKEERILANSNVSSMLVPQKRPRSSTPVNELENSSKKNAIICDFFARGWCIKGNSCPFLHQKERKKDSIAEPSRKENVLDGSGCHGESKSMSLSSQEKPYPLKPLLQTQTNEHIIAGDQIPKREPYNSSPFLRRCSYSPPVIDSGVNQRCRFNCTPLSSSNYLNNSRCSLDPMNLTDNGIDKGQSSASSSLPKDPSSFLLKFTKKPSNFPAHLWRKIESEEHLWETSTPFVPTYPSIIAQLYPHKKLYDSRNVLTSTNVLNSTAKNGSQNLGTSAFAHESYGQSSGAKPLLPKEEKYVSTHNSIDVASANNDIGVTSANIVRGAMQGQNSNLKHGGGDMEVESKESKVMKAFRVALIDFVKELVKPFWHEGRLTKDAHKKVVKKSVEKVICSFEAYQIPSESDSINQYLSTNRPKLLKLVEAYVAKYSIA